MEILFILQYTGSAMKTLKDGKAATITIKISQKTRDRAMALYKKIDSNMSFGSFLGEMVIKGLAFEEIWREKERAALEEFARNSPTSK
jgi:hypothetical protein